MKRCSKSDNKERIFDSIPVSFILIDESISALGPDNRVTSVRSDHQSSTKASAAMQSLRVQTLCSSLEK